MARGYDRQLTLLIRDVPQEAYRLAMYRPQKVSGTTRQFLEYLAGTFARDGGTTAGIPEPYTSNAGSFYMKMYLIARSGVVAFYAPCGLEYYKRIEVLFRGNASIWLNYVACG